VQGRCDPAEYEGVLAAPQGTQCVLELRAGLIAAAPDLELMPDVWLDSLVLVSAQAANESTSGIAVHLRNGASRLWATNMTVVGPAAQGGAALGIYIEGGPALLQGE
jgi:hypothetical protein